MSSVFEREAVVKVQLPLRRGWKRSSDWRNRRACATPTWSGNGSGTCPRFVNRRRRSPYGRQLNTRRSLDHAAPLLLVCGHEGQHHAYAIAVGPQDRAALGTCRPARSSRSKTISMPPRARRSSRPRAATRPAAGPSGRKAFSSARPSCSSTPPATPQFLEIGRSRTLAAMAPHVGHFGVHDHGFNNVSTYGNLLRLMGEGRIPADPWERCYYELALKLSGAIQARRWTKTQRRRRLHLFVQRAAFAVRRHDPLAPRPGPRPQAGPCDLGGERPEGLAVGSPARPRHGHGDATRSTTARAATPTTFAAAWPTSRSSTSTTAPTAARTRSKATRRSPPGRAAWPGPCAASPSNWSFWPTLPCHGPGRSRADRSLSEGRPGHVRFLHRPGHGRRRHSLLGHRGAQPRIELGDWQGRPADPFNPHEPVDSSAAAIAAQGLLRLGHYLNHEHEGRRYWQAGLTVLDTLLGRAVSEHRSESSGADLAQHLSPAQRLGLRAARPASALRRIEHVGRLPRPRSGPVRRSAWPSTSRRLTFWGNSHDHG